MGLIGPISLIGAIVLIGLIGSISLIRPIGPISQITNYFFFKYFIHAKGRR